ncbi:hypothetical protein XENOCAPTIV_011262 [Xenoophorus captivus]|uniref:Uncharacterized protein n=1 Tax=Xenoophorus captivus TaxID=1517983 RepID=A0ABV0SHR9_9TELE
MENPQPSTSRPLPVPVKNHKQKGQTKGKQSSHRKNYVQPKHQRVFLSLKGCLTTFISSNSVQHDSVQQYKLIRFCLDKQIMAARESDWSESHPYSFTKDAHSLQVKKRQALKERQQVPTHVIQTIHED